MVCFLTKQGSATWPALIAFSVGVTVAGVAGAGPGGVTALSASVGATGRLIPPPLVLDLPRPAMRCRVQGAGCRVQGTGCKGSRAEMTAYRAARRHRGCRMQGMLHSAKCVVAHRAIAPR